MTTNINYREGLKIAFYTSQIKDARVCDIRHRNSAS